MHKQGLSLILGNIEGLKRSKSHSIGAIQRFSLKAKSDGVFNELLMASLIQAKTLGSAKLDTALFEALSWPTTLDDYIAYLNHFATWAPQQSGDVAWEKPGTDEHQEVYDRLCHFYWLIDQEVGPGNSIIIENSHWFSDWLVDYAQAWGSFLNTTDSFNDEILKSFIKYAPEYRVEDSMIGGSPNNPSGWLTFNQFFARELNPGLRPIVAPLDNTLIASPADCTFKATYSIGQDSTIDDVVVKKTHTFANIETLLKGSIYEDAFANGSFAHYFLGPYSYHRFHAPVSGIVRECYPIQGLVYLDVTLSGNQFEAPDSSKGGYEFGQARGVITIDTTDSPYGNVGIVAVIPVGMCQVSSVNMTATIGRELLKGDEFGYFLFGGSDIIVLFQEGVQARINTGLHYRHYGTEIARGDIIRN